MNPQEIKALLPEGFPEDSRVWVYPSSRPFSEQQAIEIKEQLQQFYTQWMVHGIAAKGWAGLLFNRFIIMMVDERHLPISGCSIDSATRIIKSIERQYEAKLFDRLSITFLIEGKPEVLPLSQVQYAIDKNFIDGDTLMFNNMVEHQKDLIEQWILPASRSWLKEQVAFAEVNKLS